MGNFGGEELTPYNPTEGGYKQVSIRKEVEIEVQRLEEQLQVKQEMLKLLAENPAIERFMDLSRGILKG